MNRIFALVSSSSLLVGLLCSASGTQSTAGSTAPRPAAAPVLAHVCSSAPEGFAACDAQVVVDSTGKPAATKAATTAKPKGYGPADIRSAYALSATAGAGRTVAVVTAYNDPTAESDLAVYRRTYGLPACTSANGCFRKVSQTGSTSKLPRTDAGWATETSLDLDMVSATCGACKILLVEATTSSMADLAAAVNYAATQRVSAISNSYSSADTKQSAAYNHPGIAIVASVGDNGYGLASPASYATVIAVGGTSLKKATNARGWYESAWGSSGSGCSKLNAKPSWQTTATQCPGKAVADVSAVADPRTGVAVYDSTRFQGVSGWQIYGGTSAAAPIIASVYAMSGRTAGYPASYTWTHTAGLNDITAGINGHCPAATSRWCTTRVGWDGVTGLGTPRGTSSF